MRLILVASATALAVLLSCPLAMANPRHLLRPSMNHVSVQIALPRQESEIDMRRLGVALALLGVTETASKARLKLPPVQLPIHLTQGASVAVVTLRRSEHTAQADGGSRNLVVGSCPECGNQDRDQGRHRPTCSTPASHAFPVG